MIQARASAYGLVTVMIEAFERGEPPDWALVGGLIEDGGARAVAVEAAMIAAAQVVASARIMNLSPDSVWRNLATQSAAREG